MGGDKLRKLMTFIMILGLSITGLGLGLALFTERVSHGSVDDILLIALLIAGGLLILVPAKIYLTLQFMKVNDEAQQNLKNKTD